MLVKAEYNERPAPVDYAILPEGKADIWLRKNIQQAEKEGREEGETPQTVWKADEAYMRVTATKDDIEAANFDEWWTTAEAWEYTQATAVKPQTQAERIASLEAENTALKEQLADTMDAVDFLLFGGDE